MRRAGWLAVFWVVAAGAVLAQPGVPGPAYFSGLYERVGRGLDDQVQVSPDGIGLRLHACTGTDILLVFDPYGDSENAMIAGTDAGDLGGDLDCLFHTDDRSRPILTCRSEAGARFTLWPAGPDFRSAPLVCG